MSNKIFVLLSQCSICSGIDKSDVKKIIDLLNQDKRIGKITSVGLICDKKSRKEIKSLSAVGCDRAIIVSWCSKEQLGEINLPKSIHPSLVEFIDFSIQSPKGSKDHASIEKLAKSIQEAVAKLSLAVPVHDKKIKFSSKKIAVIGSSDSAVKATKALALHGIKSKLLIPQSLPKLHIKDAEIIDSAIPDGLNGIPGNFKISYVRNGMRSETDAAAVLLIGERCLVNVRPPANPRVRFIPLEQFDDHIKSGSKVKGMVFMDDIGSLAPSSDPIVPAWHTLLESAKTAATNDLAEIITVIARDVKAAGLLELSWKEAAEHGVIFMRYDDKTRPKLDKSEPLISVKDLVLGDSVQIPADIIVAPVTTKPWEPTFIEKLLVPSDWNFRVRSRGPQRGLGQSSCDGIFMIGYSGYAKLTDQSYPDMGSVISQIAALMRCGYHVAKGAIAEITEDKCSGCNTCVRTCPYRAAKMNDRWKAEIISDKCAGCGNCVSVCPSKAIELKNCTRQQIETQVAASMEVGI